jgi:hypothetical protein
MCSWRIDYTVEIIPHLPCDPQNLPPAVIGLVKPITLLCFDALRSTWENLIEVIDWV